MMRILHRAIVAGSLLLAACADETKNEPGTSTFIGEMSGAYSTTLEGEAVFGVVLGDGINSSGFALILGDGGDARILLTTPSTPKPPVGTYDIVAPGSSRTDTVFKGTMAYTVGGTLEEFAIQGGSITLARSTHNAVTGNFEFRAERTSPCCGPVPVQVFITGTFDAAQIPQVF